RLEPLPDPAGSTVATAAGSFLPSSLPRHGEGVRRPADDDHVHIGWHIGRSVGDVGEGDLGAGGQAVGDRLGDRGGVAEHGLVDDERAHGVPRSLIVTSGVLPVFGPRPGRCWVLGPTGAPGLSRAGRRGARYTAVSMPQ